tara:strand:+ start:437 stop:814 length:378 start_codon:yes stop_codon:yes gene_type:complete
MKKLLILLITFTTLTNISYASFPVVESNAKILAIEPEDDEDDGPSYWGILGGVLFFGTIYLLVRTIWRAWEKRKWWARKLIPLLILISLPTFLIGYIGHLISIVLLILLGLIMLIRKLMGKTILW